MPTPMTFDHDLATPDYDLTTFGDVADYMWKSTSQIDWDERVADVLEANYGQYPLFWNKAVIKSGIATTVSYDWDKLPKRRKRP